MVTNKVRPSPSESATLFKVGSIKKGNDGNKWTVSSTASGIHRWKKLSNGDVSKTTKKTSRKGSRKEKEILQLTKINNLKKITTINMTGPVGIGDFDYNILKLKKGIYNVYKVDDNLLLINSSYNITKDFIKNIVWIKNINGVSVDSGTFGFFDIKIVEQINKLIPRKKMIKSGALIRTQNGKNGLPRIDLSKYLPNGNFFVITTKMLEEIDQEDLPEELINYKYGVMSPTGVGDGYFDCYTSGNDMAILLGGFTTINLYEGDDEEENMPGNLKYFKKHVIMKNKRLLANERIK